MERGVRHLPVASLKESEAALMADGCEVFRLPAGIVDKDSFFDAVRRVLPLDPPLVSNRSWAALSDSLWQGLFDLSSHCVAITWTGCDAMAMASPKDYQTAISILEDLADSLADPNPTLGKPKLIAVLLGQ